MLKTLLKAGKSYTVTTNNLSINTALEAGAKGVSIYALTADCFFKIGNGAQTATNNDCYLAQGERLDFDLTGIANPNIAFIISTTGTATVVRFNTLN